MYLAFMLSWLLRRDFHAGTRTLQRRRKKLDAQPVGIDPIIVREVRLHKSEESNTNGSR